MRGTPRSYVANVPYHREESPARVEKDHSTGNILVPKVPDFYYYHYHYFYYYCCYCYY